MNLPIVATSRSSQVTRTDSETEPLDLTVLVDHNQFVLELAHDVHTNLFSAPRSLPAKWLYDVRGCELFQLITEQPEYYVTRAEEAALRRHADAIGRRAPVQQLVELGSGSSAKTRLLVEGLAGGEQLRHFVGFDIAEASLGASLGVLGHAVPDLHICGIVGDFERHLTSIPDGRSRMVSLLGSTLGNLDDARRTAFLHTVGTTLHAGDWLLMGVDLVKSPARLLAAYDDQAGFTAEFERNILTRLNRELGSDFDPSQFKYRCRWNAELERIEMGLVSLAHQHVRIPNPGFEIDITAGEEIRTEISKKFRREALESELAAHSFQATGWWTDPGGDFALSLSAKAP
jgi:L-histidine N-alpha-methyltransferase